jgi:hypothetical protein
MPHPDKDYVAQAIRTLEAGELKSHNSSHFMGVFGRASQAVEAHIRQNVAHLIDRASLDYDKELKPHLKNTNLARLTLGQLAHSLAMLAEHTAESLAAIRPQLLRMADLASQVNESWVAMKHSGPVSDKQATDALNKMLILLDWMNQPGT